MKAAVAYLRSRPDVDGARIGVDRLVHGRRLLARSRRSASRRSPAPSCTTAGSSTDPASIADLKVPLLGNFGGKDQGIPVEGVEAFAGRGEEGRQERGLQDLPGRGPRVRVVEGPEGLPSGRREGRRRAGRRVFREEY